MNHTETHETVAACIWRVPKVELEGGGTLHEVEVAYRTWGVLNEAGTNAILICHALTGDADAFGTEEEPGWWQGLFGPGRALDPHRHFLICSNVLGGCAGTTGPASIDPGTRRPYGSSFPTVTVRDMVHVQHGLIRSLGVRELALVVGGSMGGLQAIEWAALYPSFVRRCAVLAASAALSALALGYNEAMRMAVTNDPAWQGGDYHAGPGPVQGLALARKIGMLTYRSFELFQERFGRERVPGTATGAWIEAPFQIGSYLEYAGRKLTGRFDAGSYLCLLKAMDLHDIGRGRGGEEAALRSISCPVLWVGIDSDRLYPAAEQRDWAERLRRLGKQVTYREIQSPFGHDAFLIEWQQVESMMAGFISDDTGGRAE